jgi:hypothetical protein
MPRKPSSEEEGEAEKKDSSLAIDEAASLTARPDVVGLSTEHVALHGMNKILWDQYLWPFFQSQGHHLQAFARERDSRALQQQWNVCTLTNPQYVTSDAARMAQIFKFYHISPTQVKVHVKGSTLLFLNTKCRNGPVTPANTAVYRVVTMALWVDYNKLAESLRAQGVRVLSPANLDDDDD